LAPSGSAAAPPRARCARIGSRTSLATTNRKLPSLPCPRALPFVGIDESVGAARAACTDRTDSAPVATRVRPRPWARLERVTTHPRRPPARPHATPRHHNHTPRRGPLDGTRAEPRGTPRHGRAAPPVCPFVRGKRRASGPRLRRARGFICRNRLTRVVKLKFSSGFKPLLRRSPFCLCVIPCDLFLLACVGEWNRCGCCW
jgi:hypothetical protein